MDLKEIIKQNISITDLAGILNLKKSGGLYYCINPTHQDDTPSLKLYDDTNSFNCFGCNAGGDIFNLYMLYYGKDFKSTLQDLANHCGINPIEYKSQKTKEKFSPAEFPINKPAIKSDNNYKFLCEYDKYSFDERAGIMEYSGDAEKDSAERYALNQVRAERLQRNKIIFNELYNYCMLSGLDDKANEYLTHHRRLSADVIQKNKIFTLNDIPSITKYLTTLFDITELTGTGLFKDNKFKFSTNHRLIIPYLKDGEIIYLRARYLTKQGDTNTDKMKYDGLYNDSLNLNRVKRFYNIDTLSNVGEYDKLYIAEGELDALALETLDLKAVAIPGVNSIPAEIDFKIFENNHIVICFDNDTPGRTATNELIKIFRKFNINYSTITLPEGIKDINEFLIMELNK